MAWLAIGIGAASLCVSAWTIRQTRRNARWLAEYQARRRDR